MIKQRINKILQGKYSLGVEVYTENGETIYNLMLLKEKEKGVHVEQFYGYLKSIEEVKEKIGTKHPVGLVISGSRILTKKINVGKTEEVVNNLHQTFPGMDLENFYFQLCFPEEENAPISLARKEDVGNEVDSWLNHGFSIVNVFIGDFPLSCLCTEALQSYSFKDKVSNDRERMEVNMLLSGVLFLRPELMPKLAANMNFIHHLKQEYNSRKIFNGSFAFGLSVILLALLVNFFFYNSYEKEALSLDQQLQLKQSTLSKINDLKKEVKQKENLLLSIGGSNQSKSSFYADRIASCIPEGIQLESMFIYPVKRKKTAGKQEFDFDRKTILLSGITGDSFLLNELMGKLQEMEWVGKVEVNNYASQLNDKGKFDITIELS